MTDTTWIDAAAQQPPTGFLVMGGKKKAVWWSGQGWYSTITGQPTTVERWRLLDDLEVGDETMLPVLRDARPARMRLLDQKRRLYYAIIEAPSDTWMPSDIELCEVLGRDPEMQEFFNAYGEEEAVNV
jgi:hypothetical protein